ncbi:MAG: type II secretion system F family protein [Deltaproteobacteria bacterium]|nr:type II secretion system F family protein [Deltaproteobacteria bacterium]MCL5792926.1 type II secretion system F family protein [Deltaproteobacteria bacterium]
MIIFIILSSIFAGLGMFILVTEGIDRFEHGIDIYKLKVISQVKELDSLYMSVTPQRLLYLNLFISFITFALVSIFTSSIIAGIAVSPLGLFISKVWIIFIRKKRIRIFNEQFIDAIGIISNALKSGLSLQQAIARVAEQYPAPISQELSMVIKEIALGTPLEQALINLSKRVKSEDVELFVTATNVVKDVGANLSEMFDRITDTIRERNTIQGKIKALTSQGRMQGIVIGLMPVALGLVLYKLDPNFIKPLFTDPIGWLILLIVMVFEGIGAFFIVKIIRIDV